MLPSEQLITTEDLSWAEIEFSGAEFGDNRLTNRLVHLTKDLSNNPEAAINRASRDWSATKGAYRFFANEKVTPIKILSPHREQTLERIKRDESNYCLAIQDTTFLNFNDHRACNGLGFIGSTENLKVMIAHTTLACSVKGLPLGILEQKLYIRSEISTMSSREREKLPISQKESVRWLESIRAITAAIDNTTTTTTTSSKEASSSSSEQKKIVTVCDREGDITELLVEAEKLNVGYLIRSSAPRKIISTEPHSKQNLHEAVKKAPIAANVQFLPATLGSSNGKLKKQGLPTFVVRVVAAKGKKTLEWFLLTNIAVNNIEDAIERIRWYQLRWHIEIFHKILKSGCTIEAVRLASVQKLNRCVTLYSIIAWRIFFLTHLQRISPQVSANFVLSHIELQVLKKILYRKNSEIDISTLTGATKAIATLGGYMNRKNDPAPGPIVIWRGYTKLQEAVLTAHALMENTCG